MNKKLPIVVCFLFTLTFALFTGIDKTYAVSQTTNETYPVSQGVNYSNYTYSGSVVNHLEVDLSNIYTKVGLSVPSPINSVVTLTERANQDSKEGNRVVGAINANFYNMGDGYPLYLISQYNMIISPEVISDSSSNYVSQPIAFGVTADGNADIAYYNSEIIVNYKGESTKINGLNVNRESNQGIVYTPQNFSSLTPTNPYGVEFVVETPETITATKFGQTLTGKVTAIRKYGDTTKSKIPRNGFVLSVNGNVLEKYKNIKLGEEISVSFSIDDRWKDAQFMMASGPLLVLDGKVNVTMNTQSSRATEIAPRTAIAISKDKKTVHLITVDGRQSNSNGMTIAQFANYLAQLGVDRAINLDGGGSTTMGIRKYGSNAIVLANNPSGGTQRRINAIIEAISTGKTGSAKNMKISRDKVGTMLVGSTVTLTPKYLLDEHYNPVPMRASDFTITPQNKLVTVNGLSYTAVATGSERISVKNGGASQIITFDVVDAPANLSISSSDTTIEPNDSLQFEATVKDKNGDNVIYSPSQLKWSVEGDIGTISGTGLFKSNGNPGKGSVVVSLGNKTVKKDIEVIDSLFRDIAPDYVYKEEINYLVENGYIKGYPDGSFKPQQSLTRSHAAVFLVRALKLKTSNPKNPGFTDLKTSHPYYKEIATIVNAGIMNGTGNNKFDPDAELTRAQMAKILVEAFELSGSTTSKFKDVNSKHWAYEYIHSLAANNITTGFRDNTYQPSLDVSRVHFSLFLYRSINK